MTRALSDALATINAVIALLITIGGGVAGYHQVRNAEIGTRLIWTVFGGLTGFVVAALLCGALATLLLIENHLRNIRAMNEDLHRRETRR